MKRILCLVIAVIFMFSMLVGCGGAAKSVEKVAEPAKNEAPKEEKPAPKPEENQIVLRLAEVHPQDYPTTKGDFEFARLVEERTNGRIKIEVYFGGQLGDEKSVIEQVQFGAIDFARISISPVSEFAKDLNALQLPYIYRDGEHMWKVLNGSIGEELLKSVEKAKLVGLCWYDAGSRNFYNTKKEVKSVADLKGLKIRVQESKLMMGLVSSLGASPTPMAYGEVYSALQTGVIDGAENNWPSYVSSSHYEVAKYFTVDNHTMVPEITVASPAAMSKLSAEDQKIVKKAAKDATEYQKAEWAKYAKESEDKAIAAGCKITRLDAATVEEFQKAVSPLYDEIGKDYADLIKKIQDTK